jgi:ATP-binding cassette subfamily F protein 3
MPSKDVLKAALKDFNGTVICVSHDRDFLDGIVSKIYEFGGGRVREHLGGIYDFLRAKKIDSLQELEITSSPRNPRNPSSPSGATDYAAQKAAAAERRKKERQIAETEAKIAALEEQQAQMESLLAEPANQTPENFHTYETIKHQIEQELYVWELLSEEA